MKVYGTTEAAAEIGCDPRALRRFLRSNDSYRNAGIGGRYFFDASELASLKRTFLKHYTPAGASNKGQEAPESAKLNQDEGVPLEQYEASRGDRRAEAKLRTERREARAARQQRLRTRIADVLEPRYDDEPSGDAQPV